MQGTVSQVIQRLITPSLKLLLIFNGFGIHVMTNYIFSKSGSDLQFSYNFNFSLTKNKSTRPIDATHHRVIEFNPT